MTCFFMLIGYVFFMQYCVIRQAFAIAIFYVAYCCYLEKGRNKGYCLLILLATLFHTSALVLLLLPLLKRIHPTKRHTLLLLAGALLLTLCLFQLLSLFGLQDSVYYKVALQKETFSIFGMMELAIVGTTVGTCYGLHRRMHCKAVDRNVYAVFILALCVAIMLPVFSFFSRINDYLWPLIIVIFLRYVHSQPTDSVAVSHPQYHLAQRVAVLFIGCVFVARIAVVSTFRPEWLHLVPYRFYDFSNHYHYYHLYPQK